MKTIKIAHVEEILELSSEIKKVEIAQDAVIKYIYYNRNNEDIRININELKNAYAKSLNKLYKDKNYYDDITIGSGDIKKICLN